MMYKRNIKPEFTLYGDREGSDIITEHCFGFQTIVSTQSMSGSFVIQVVPAVAKGTRRSNANLIPYLYRRVAANDIITIKYTSNEPYFMGIVDSVSLGETRDENGNYSRSLNIKGRNGGKMLENMALSIDDMAISQLKDAYKNVQAAFPDKQWDMGMIEKLSGFVKENAGAWSGTFLNQKYFDALKILFDAAGLIDYPIRWAIGSGDRNEWRDFLMLDKRWIKQYPGEAINTDEAILAHTLAQSIQGMIDPNFAESWIDTKVVDGKLYWVLRMRPKPFDRLDDYLPLYPAENEPDSIADVEFKTIRDWIEHNREGFKDFGDATWDKMKNFVDEGSHWTIGGSYSQDIELDDSEMYSVYRSDYVLTSGETIPTTKPLVDIMAFMKYGYKQLNATQRNHIDKKIWDPDLLNVASEDELDGVLDETNETKMRRRELWGQIEHKVSSMRMFNWFGMNNLMAKGATSFPADDRVRAGDKIYMPGAPTVCGDPQAGLYAYGHTVTQQWNRLNGGMTQVSFNRGHNDSIRAVWLASHSVDDIRAQMQQTIWSLQKKWNETPHTLRSNLP